MLAQLDVGRIQQMRRVPQRHGGAARPAEQEHVGEKAGHERIERGHESIQMNGQPAEQKEQYDDYHELHGLFQIALANDEIHAYVRSPRYAVVSVGVAAAQVGRLDVRLVVHEVLDVQIQIQVIDDATVEVEDDHGRYEILQREVNEYHVVLHVLERILEYAALERILAEVDALERHDVVVEQKRRRIVAAAATTAAAKQKRVRRRRRPQQVVHFVVVLVGCCVLLLLLLLRCVLLTGDRCHRLVAPLTRDLGEEELRQRENERHDPNEREHRVDLALGGAV